MTHRLLPPITQLVKLMAMPSFSPIFYGIALIVKKMVTHAKKENEPNRLENKGYKYEAKKCIGTAILLLV